MSKRVVCFLFIILHFWHTGDCFGQIEQIQRMEEIRSLIEAADQETLVVFDIDQTLTVSKNPAYQWANFQKYQHLLREMKADWSEDQLNMALNLIAVNPQDGVELIDREVLSIFNFLHAKGIPTIALSATITGPCGEVADPLPYRVKQLKELGIDFSPLAPHTLFLCMQDLPPYLGSHPESVSGLVFSNGERNTKGEVLTHFFDQIGWEPKRVIFIDDLKNQLESCEKPLAKRGISFEGIHYLGYSSLPSKPIEEHKFIREWEKLGQRAAHVLASRPK
ncbi:MAG: hypothetical protein K940chlam9_01005 [Chlamydiae bacterium]|nr:hypothetical protein [Chlamydiota bacterium]